MSLRRQDSVYFRFMACKRSRLSDAWQEAKCILCRRQTCARWRNSMARFSSFLMRLNCYWQINAGTFAILRPCWNFISQLMSGFIILENGQRAEEWRSSPFKFGKPAMYMFSGLSGLSRDRVHFDGKALAACVRWIGDVQIPALLNLCG